MKRKKRLLSMLLCLALCLSSLSFAASADAGGEIAGYSPGDVVDGTILTMDESSESLMPYGDYLAQGGCSITKVDDDIAKIYGYTSCYQTADSVTVGVYLDRLESGRWRTIYSKTFTGTDTYYVSYGISVFVTPGYYYRVRASHIVKAGSRIESNSSATNGIYF